MGQEDASLEDDTYTRDFLPIEKHILESFDDKISLSETNIDELNVKARYIIQLTGLVSASGITALGIYFNRDNFNASPFRIFVIFILLIGIITCLVLILKDIRNEILTPDEIDFKHPVDIALENLSEKVNTLSDYILDYINVQGQYFEELDRYGSKLQQTVIRMAVLWFWYTVLWVAFIFVILL